MRPQSLAAAARPAASGKLRQGGRPSEEGYKRRKALERAPVPRRPRRARRARAGAAGGGLKEEHEKRRNAKQRRRAALGKLGAFYISLGYHAVIWV